MNKPTEGAGHRPLAPHSFQILLSLLQKDLHGYALLKDIAHRTGGEMVLGTSTLYAALQRLVKDGFLEEVQPPSQDPVQGPPRKVFRITRAGRGLARDEARRIERLHQMVAETSLLSSMDPNRATEERS